MHIGTLGELICRADVRKRSFSSYCAICGIHRSLGILSQDYITAKDINGLGYR